MSAVLGGMYMIVSLTGAVVVWQSSPLRLVQGVLLSLPRLCSVGTSSAQRMGHVANGC